MQPQGGIKFNERYIAQGDCYVACLNVYSLAEDIPPLWLTTLMNNKDTLSSFDVATANKEEVVKDINRSISELKDRMTSERRSTDRDDANWELENLKLFARSITQQGEIVKLVKIRIYIYDPVLEQLEKRIGDLKKRLQDKTIKRRYMFLSKKKNGKHCFQVMINKLNTSEQRVVIRCLQKTLVMVYRSIIKI
ncbi:hypothetical protein AAHB46_00860 [Bacillus paranthracis]